MQKLSRTTTLILLLFLTWLAVPVQVQDTLSAQVLRLLDRANTWSAAQTFNAGITVTSCVGCGTASGSAPDNAQYWVGAPNGTLSAEKDLSALSTGLVVNTAGVPSAYAGSTCTTGYATAISASGTTTCASGWVDVVAMMDQDISSQTTPQNDNELFCTLAAATIYEFQATISYSSPVGGTTPDMKIAFTGPATLTGQWAQPLYVTTADSFSGAFGQITINGGTGAMGTATTPRLTYVNGWVYSTAGGAGASGLLFQWSQNTSNSSATRRLAGSTLRCRRIT